VGDASQVPYRFDRTHSAAAVHAEHKGLAADAETGETVSVAGRVMLLRRQGKLCFGELRDSSGSIQLFALAAVTDRFDAFCELHLGDWVGATGEVVTTRTGELSVKVKDWVLLAAARRQFGDKWRGVTDVDIRYRQRYVDLWANEETRWAFAMRDRCVHLLRRFMEERGFVEVDTPVFQPLAGGAAARPFVSHHNALDLDLFLRVAPELYLKRLVVGGYERVFELARVFRNEGLSPRHNPEFTMLEAYAAYWDYTDMMALVEELVSELARSLVGGTTVSYAGRPVELAPPWRRATMTELVEEHTGRPISVSMPVADLRRRADTLGVAWDPSFGPGKLVLEIFERTTEPELWGPVFVCDYPAEVSPLARAHRSAPGLVERFEAIVTGRELCNAFSELVDPVDQRARFEEQAALRAAGDEEAMALDEDYLRALEYGLPPTAGLGIGVDRLVMLLTDRQSIRDVILFPTLRPEQGESGSGR